MKQKPILFLTAIVLATLPQAMAQKTFSFSARQAVDHAMKNAIEVKNAMLDIQIQQQSNREFTAIAFPQISSNVSVTHFLDIPTTTLPDFHPPDVYGGLGVP